MVVLKDTIVPSKPDGNLQRSYGSGSTTVTGPLLMGLDVGTTGCRALVFSEDGKIVSSMYKEYPLYHRQPDWSELNPCQVWQAVLGVLRASSEMLGKDVRAIRAVSVSALGEAFFPVDGAGKPVYWSMTTFDSRATSEVKWWIQNFGAREIYALTGQPLSEDMPIYPLQKVQWLRENEPLIFARVKRLVCWQDYVNLKLCGVAALDYSLASRTMMFDINRRQWSSEILSQAGLDEGLLSDAVPSGTVIGEVSARSAAETGLPCGTLVVTGGHDQPCGALGVGILGQGPAMDATGTVECVATVQRSLRLTDKMMLEGFSVQCHVAGEGYLVFGFNPSAGVILRWFRDNFGQVEKAEAESKETDVYDLMVQQAEKAPEGSRGLVLLPFFEGSGNPCFKRGIRGALLGLTLAQGRADVIRSILEGVTFELRNIVDALETHTSVLPELRAIGGAAKSKFWLQLKADVTGRRVVVPRVQEAAALGAAMLAGIGAGVYEDFEDAVKHTYSVRETFLPKEETAEAYRRLYTRYKSLCERMRDILTSLNEPFT